MAGPGKEYVIGKGKLYFDQFAPGSLTGSGEQYFGNTPELSTSSDQETLDHYDADEGLNVKDESVTIEDNMTGAFVTDNISRENLALWFGGERSTLVQVAATGLSDTFVAVKKGRWFQLGAGALTPSGVRNVENVVVNVLAGGTGAPTVVVAADNLDFDLEGGRVYVELDSPAIADGDTIEVTYDVQNSERDVTVGKGMDVRGSLRFLSRNPIGSQTDYFWPYVKITANGDLNMKGDEWQQIPFSFEILKKNATTERVYIDNRKRG